LVYIETVVKGRRVFLDFRNDPEDFEFGALSSEAREYLARSKALIPKPIERLRIMNPDAVTLYADHDIDIAAEPLEIAVCAQHNNGGLAGNIWWASTNIKHLFVVGEVNGSHGVARPGGSALNAGQVGGFRAAEFIANRYANWTLDTEAIKAQAGGTVGSMDDGCQSGTQNLASSAKRTAGTNDKNRRSYSVTGKLKNAVSEAWEQWSRMAKNACGFQGLEGLRDALNTRQLCYAHVVYLEALLFGVRSGVGSRGSAMVLDPKGVLPHPKLGEQWKFIPENTDFRNKVLTSRIDSG
jgi:succinate dehydrogenase/fumarate reductase flavoprotein subunit